MSSDSHAIEKSATINGYNVDFARLNASLDDALGDDVVLTQFDPSALEHARDREAEAGQTR